MLKVKLKATLQQAMKSHKGSGSIIFRTPHHNTSDQGEFLVFLLLIHHTSGHTTPHGQEQKIPTINQALLHRTAPPTTQASDQDRPAPPERVEHPT